MARPRVVLTRSKSPTPPPTNGPQLIGYARVSTEDQILDLQLNALKAAGCDPIFQEKVSAGGTKRRPQLDLLMKYIGPGDVLVVWRLDRLARSMEEFHARLKQIHEAGASFRSLTENFDFGTAMGEFVLNILVLVAQLERQLTRTRTLAGLEAAKARGVKLGRATKFTDEKKRRAKIMLALRGPKKLTAKQIGARLGVSAATIYDFKKTLKAKR